jgi:proline iminopeptidase
MSADAYFSQHAPYDEGLFPVGQGHHVWYVQYGSPDGIPLMWLHGGPGSGSSPRHQRFVDPLRYRLVMFDQRGCGNSRPAGEIRDNDTGRLVRDIEQLRAHLGIGRFLLGGGSWGAALALAYAETHRTALSGLVLRAPFLAGRRDTDHFFQAPDGADPAWLAFAGQAPASHRRDLLHYYASQILGPDSRRGLALAQAWALYQQQREQPQTEYPGLDAVPELPASDSRPPDSAAHSLLARYRIQSHYLLHGCFLEEDRLLDAAARLNGLPVAILHGAQDPVCDPDNARRLHHRIAGSRLQLVAQAGHDPYHPAMSAALIAALGCFSDHGNFECWGDDNGSARTQH